MLVDGEMQVSAGLASGLGQFASWDVVHLGLEAPAQGLEREALPAPSPARSPRKRLSLKGLAAPKPSFGY